MPKPVGEIRRTVLLECVERAIQETSGLSRRVSNDVRRTAHEIKKVAVGAWYDSEAKCGCVVGELLNVDDEHMVLERLGLHIPQRHPLIHLGEAIDRHIEETRKEPSGFGFLRVRDR